MTTERDFAEEEIVARLLDVQRDGEHHIPLHFADERNSELYRYLSSEGLIRWCPYPEEFYVITPEGRQRVEGGDSK